MGSRFRNIAGKLLLSVAAVFLTLILLEGVFRLFDIGLGPLSGKGLFVEDKILGYRLKKNYYYDGEQITNSYGLHDDEFPLQKKPREKRILILGDSFTYGFTDFKDTYPQQLEKLLSQDSPVNPVQVINAGIPVYGLGQELEFLRGDGFQFQPEIVILGLFVGNDFTDFTGNLACVDGELIDHNVLENYSGFWGRLRLHTRIQFERLHLVRFLEDREWLEVSGLSEQESVLTIQHERYPLLLPNWYEKNYGAERWKVTCETLRRFRDLCRSRGVLFLLLIIPDMNQVDYKVLEEVVRRSGFGSMEAVADLPQRHLREFCGHESIPYLDVLLDFQEASLFKQLYLPNDTHFNSKGNKLLATLLRDYFRAHHMLIY